MTRDRTKRRSLERSQVNVYGLAIPAGAKAWQRAIEAASVWPPETDDGGTALCQRNVSKSGYFSFWHAGALRTPIKRSIWSSLVMAAALIFSETDHSDSASNVALMAPSNTDDLRGPGVPNLNGLRVLLVEDSWQVSAALKRLFEAHGANVAGPVATTADAVRSISERPIDVAVVDINLRDGELAYDLIDQLHDQGIRIVVLTGYDHLPLEQGKVAAVLRKPAQAHELLRSLRPE